MTAARQRDIAEIIDRYVLVADGGELAGIREAAEEIDSLVDASVARGREPIGRVRELHSPRTLTGADQQVCKHCGFGVTAWPCPTIRLLDSPATRRGVAGSDSH